MSNYTIMVVIVVVVVVVIVVAVVVVTNYVSKTPRRWAMDGGCKTFWCRVGSGWWLWLLLLLLLLLILLSGGVQSGNGGE